MLKLTVPFIPSSINTWSRAHWRTRNADRVEWADRMGDYLLLAGCRKRSPMFKGKVRVTLVYHIKGKRQHDLDNMSPKHLLDAMIGWVYPDDGPDYVAELVQSHVHGAKADATDIVVEPLAAPPRASGTK